MKTFALPAGSHVNVVKATPHKEAHGKNLVQAVSLRLEWCPIDNAALNMLAEGLQDALLFDPEETGQQSAEGIPSVKKHRRCPDLKMPVQLPKAEFSGYEMTIEHGIDESSALTLYGVKMTKFEATVSEGGVAVIRWSANSNRQVTPELLGALCTLDSTEVVITSLTPPAAPIDGSEDGGGPGFEPNAGDLFAAQHGDDGDDLADEGEQETEEEADALASDDVVTIERSQPGTRTARGRDKTKAALAAGSTLGPTH